MSRLTNNVGGEGEQVRVWRSLLAAREEGPLVKKEEGGNPPEKKTTVLVGDPDKLADEYAKYQRLLVG